MRQHPMNLPHGVGMLFRQCPAHHDHMIDRNYPVFPEPGLFLSDNVGKQRLQVRMVGFLAEHRIELAVDQHLDDLLARRRALGRVREFGDMRVLERDPVDRIEIDAVVVGEDAAQPCAGRGGEGADADALVVEIARRELPRLRIVKRMRMLEPRQHDIRQQHHRLAEGFRHQVGNDRHLRDVERLLADHRLKTLVGRRILREIELNQIGFDRAILQRGRAGVVAKQRPQAHRHLSPPPACRSF